MVSLLKASTGGSLSAGFGELGPPLFEVKDLCDELFGSAHRGGRQQSGTVTVQPSHQYRKIGPEGGCAHFLGHRR